jgi:hypothetical protein
VITVAARRAKTQAAIERDVDGAAAAAAYVQRDARWWQATDARLQQRLRAGAQVAVWGAGLHTSMLLARTSLAQHAEIMQITDRDAQKHGHVLGSHQVVPPASVIAGELPIVISSFHSEAAIANDLRANGVPESRLIRLYG